MLTRLREMRLNINVFKSEFYITEIKYLDLIIILEEVKMDSKKIQEILQWEMFKYEKDVRIIYRFLDFINFYRRFIPYFFKITRSLYNLLNKKSSRLWTNVCIQTFRILQDTVSKEFVMTYFDLDK